MSAVAAATAAVGVVGAVTSMNAADKAAAGQNAATAAATKASAEQLAFQKEQYQDWKDIYGDVEENLSEFYQNYDAEEVTSLGLQNIEKEYAASKDVLIKELAQRGMDTSGLTAAALTSLAGQKASGKAQVRAEAPLKAAQAQGEFLALGMGQKSGLQQGIADSYGAQASMLTGQAGAYGKQVTGANAGLASSLGAIGTGIAANAQIDATNRQTSALLSRGV